MCELSFSDLGDLNQLFFVNQSIINALSNNHDGIGYIQSGKFWKSNLSGAKITNLGILTKDSITTDPIAFHTRYATNKSLNEDCHSHPFAGDKLLLMHNGKLEKKDTTILTHGKVDSEVFLEDLEAEIATNPDIPMVDLLPKVMDNWCGKFAFMIYDLRDSCFYVVRGTTADLHWTTVNNRLIVNTEKKDLDRGVHLLRQLNQLASGNDLEVGEIKALETNSIYKFEPKDSVLEKIGEVKENKAPLVASNWASSYNRGHASTLGAMTTVTQHNEPLFRKLRNWLDFHGMSLIELNLISEVLMGTSLLNLVDADIVILHGDILSKLTEQASTGELDDWKAILKAGYGSWAYSQPKFKFPWMLNDTLDLSDMREAVEAEVEKRKTEKLNKKVKL
jgi:hypothetical protein